MPDGFNGDKLRLARLFYGYSQEQLGELVTSSRQYIQQLESKAKIPNDDFVNVLSEALHVETDFFVDPIENDVKEEQCHFRKQRTTPANIFRQIISHATFFDWIVKKIDEKLHLPIFNFPFKDISNFKCIDEIAEECRIHWKLGIDAPIKNMMRVVENAGAVVTYFDNASNKVDALSINRQRPIIVLSSDKEESSARIRFDLAHECGHLIMHQGLETGDHKTEDEANCFASAFLLPRKAFAQEFPRSHRLNWVEIYEMKLRWKVSVRAIIRRAYDLQLIDSMQYRSANIYLNKSGQTKREKYDESIEKEPPELLQKAFEILTKSLNIYPYDIAKKLKIKPIFMERILGDKLKSFYKSNNVINIF